MIDVQALLAALPARIDAIPRAAAARTPDAPALIEGTAEQGRTLSYAALVGEIDRYAALLRGCGVRPGDRVLLVSENCSAQVALIFAASTVGAWIVNLNPRLSAPEIDAIQLHCGARLALYTAALSAEAAAHAARAGASFAADTDVMIGPLNEACAPEPVHDDPAAGDPAAGAPVAALVYTTGTTGQPKGVMLSHRNLLFVAGVSSRLRGLAPQDRAWGVLPISHVYGLTSVLLGTLSAGACLQLAPRFTPDAMLRAIRDDGLTIVQGVPAMYARLLELAGNARLPSRLRFAYAGGSPLDPDLKRRVEALLGLPLHNGYGLSEAAPTVSQTRLDAPRADTSVGQPIPGVDVRIVDQAGRDLADGQAGELWVRGPNVMRGYYREPLLTAAALRPGGWLNTGDMARHGEDGALFIVGRTRELIIRSGFNVFPLEVETVLNAHPGVTQSAVVGKAVADGNEEVVAFVQPDPRQAPTVDQLQAWAAERLAPYKRPGRIVLMKALPAAATGKILKNALKDLAAELA
ncbi:class I adenylate-forming enzyme family protein [Herbaspirillum sp. SJZ107]|uniref:class I adenylate-forming enzyme family protein n=1 Tax=Herbaspirillum sp. SJZ107 TaxID=2572881 RepID=UPI001153F2B5|nr:AMP-binding protein [Herbaspirillum sp. SJZ107]TQK07228.1 acyl-CoA synthetase (AMP-forming)/AMP-acid ligase II [Herbaspirillum sp. SJZ107]